MSPSRPEGLDKTQPFSRKRGRGWGPTDYKDGELFWGPDTFGLGVKRKGLNV